MHVVRGYKRIAGGVGYHLELHLQRGVQGPDISRRSVSREFRKVLWRDAEQRMCGDAIKHADDTSIGWSVSAHEPGNVGQRQQQLDLLDDGLRHEPVVARGL
jgi:hypothetical protein